MQHNLYFIAIIPPNDVAAQVNIFRNDLKDNYNSKAALKNIPHITLKAPFRANTDSHEVVLKWFESLQVPKVCFNVSLYNFGAFDNPGNPVIYIHPILTNALADLQEGIIKSFVENFPNIPLHFHEHQFTPHITIAFRDLAYAEFKKAWQVYSTKQYAAQFNVTNFYLLQHNDTSWKVVAEHKLQ